MEEEKELRCIEMIDSILAYESTRDIDEILEDKYLQNYIEFLGKEKVTDLIKQEIERFKNAKIIPNSYTDSEGVTYNSVKFEESQKQELADAKEALKDPNLKGDEKAEYEHDIARLENKENLTEDQLTDEERYQLRRYDTYNYGIYDQEEEKFIEKGSLKMMRAALKDIRNGNMPLEKENIKECEGVTQVSNIAPGAKIDTFGEKEKKLNESIDEDSYLENTFRNYKAYLSNNMIPLNIIQQNKVYYVYREGDLEKDQPGNYHYIYMADNKDQIEGWLYGIVQCVNHILDNK